MAVVTGHPIPPPAPLHDVDAEVEELATRLALETDPERHAELLERIVVRTLPLADSFALRYSGRGIETDDLVQVARTALVKAVHRYRPGTGSGFAAFAAPTVSGEIKRWFRDQGWAVRPPRRVQELRASLVVEEERMRHVLARDPQDEEIASVLGVTTEDITEARMCSAGYHAASLDAPTAAGTTVGEHLLVSESHSDGIEVRDALRRALALLTDRQRLVLRLRYVDELTQSEIGERIGVSQMQVSRILRTILDVLRSQLLADDTTTVRHSAA